MRMKPRNARLLDDLLHQRPGGHIYKHIRDGHVSDLAEIVGELERMMPVGPATLAIAAFTWVLIETRDIRGSDAVRTRDKLRADVLAELRADQSQVLATVKVRGRAEPTKWRVATATEQGRDCIRTSPSRPSPSTVPNRRQHPK
jgi:hypothetical protein